MRRAPASSAFSNNSLTTEAGRSTTSPAAILLATFSERTWMRPMTSRVIHHRGTEKVSQFQVSSFKGSWLLPQLPERIGFTIPLIHHRGTETERKYLSLKFRVSKEAGFFRNCRNVLGSLFH